VKNDVSPFLGVTRHGVQSGAGPGPDPGPGAVGPGNWAAAAGGPGGPAEADPGAGQGAREKEGKKLWPRCIGVLKGECMHTPFPSNPPRIVRPFSCSRVPAGWSVRVCVCPVWWTWSWFVQSSRRSCRGDKSTNLLLQRMTGKKRNLVMTAKHALHHECEQQVNA
jgi:hypothetical protein